MEITNTGGLYIEENDERTILEVVGEHPGFERNIVNAEPEKSSSFIKRLFIGALAII